MENNLSLMHICERQCNCCIRRIYASIRHNTHEWKEMEEMKFAETPLHRAAAVGNTAVALEILNLMPSLGKKLDMEGMSPLHVAIQQKYRETAETLARTDTQLVRVKGREGLTPLLQCAAESSDHDDFKLLVSLMVACPESFADMNNNCENALHIALKYQNSRAVCVLVDWHQRRNQIPFVQVKDVKGNTVLHTAARFGCLEGARILVGCHVNVNTLNYQKHTALDVAIERRHLEIVKLLISKGAKRSSDMSWSKKTPDYVLTRPTFILSISNAYNYLMQEFPLETRNTILVVATLIIAATYQGVLQPPGGVYPPDDSGASASLLAKNERRMVGRMVMEKDHYRNFMLSNTLAFMMSIMIIIFVVPGSPVFLTIHFCLAFMSFSYLLALDAISYYHDVSHMIVFMAFYTIVGAFAIKLFYYLIKALVDRIYDENAKRFVESFHE